MPTKIVMTNSYVDNQGGTFIKADKDFELDLSMDNMIINNHSSNGNNAVFYETRESMNWTEQLGLPKHANAQELYELLSILEVSKPQEREQIIKEGRFFRNLSIAADMTAVIPVITALVMNPNFHEIMKSLYKIVVGEN